LWSLSIAPPAPPPPTKKHTKHLFSFMPLFMIHLCIFKDHAVIKTTEKSGTSIGSHVTIGHNAVLTGCTVS